MEWTAPIYAFFRPVPIVEYVDGRRCHTFLCAAINCKSRGVRRFLDKGDANSTSNMRKHAKRCWGVEVIKSGDNAINANNLRETTVEGILQPKLITAAFERQGKKVTYSYRQHTKTESRAEIVRWVVENKRPFNIVNDRGFRNLMKTGRPEYHIPSPNTVSRDVKKVFVNARRRIANMLREHEGSLSFATDAWTSPNHKAFVAVTVHFENDGVPVCMILDVVEVALSHSGVNLAAAFADILDEFGVSDKVR